MSRSESPQWEGDRQLTSVVTRAGIIPESSGGGQGAEEEPGQRGTGRALRPVQASHSRRRQRGSVPEPTRSLTLQIRLLGRKK